MSNSPTPPNSQTMPASARRFRAVQRAALILIVMLVSVLTAGATYLWLSPGAAVTALESLTARFTPYVLELEAPELRWSPFHFNAKLVLLRLKQSDAIPIMSVQDLELDMPLWELIVGGVSSGRLSALNVSYYLEDSEDTEPLDLETLFAPLSRLPAQVQIDTVHLISQDENLWIFPLLELSAARNAEGLLEAMAVASFGSRQVIIQGVADWQTKDDGTHRLALDARVSGGSSDAGDSQLVLEGLIDAAGTDLSYAFTLHGEYQNVSDFLTALDPDAYAFAGNLVVDGELRGDLERYTLSISELTLTTADAYTFTAKGEVRHADAGAIELDLQARGDAQQLDVLLPIPASLNAMLERSELSLQVSGTLDRPRVTQTGLSLYGPGSTVIAIQSDLLELDLDELRTQSLSDTLSGRFSLRSRNLGEMLSPTARATLGDVVLSAAIDGDLGGTTEHIALNAHTLTLGHPLYQLQGQAKLLWADAQLSAPDLALQVKEREGPGNIRVKGTIADLAQLLGVGLELEFESLNGDQLLALGDIPTPLPVRDVSGSLLLLRAAEPWQLRDLTLALRKGDFRATASGEATVTDNMPSADLSFVVNEAVPGAWSTFTGMQSPLKTFAGQLRVRPRYATMISDMRLGESQLQGVLSADLDGDRVTELALDLYSPRLRLEDFAFEQTSPSKASRDLAPGPQRGASDIDANSQQLERLRAQLPDFPIHLTLRSDTVTGAQTLLNNVSVALEGAEQQFQLTHLDADYAGGQMMLRGAVNLNSTPVSLSIAGEGIRVPLADLTQDLGLQQAITGSLSLRGGIAATSPDGIEWLPNVNGHLALAVSDTTVSGAAYDLLMSNLMAWLVKGAGEKTTTFDCAMAEFDIRGGIAQSDNLFLETSRMLAQGKARIDTVANTVDLRLEPRSKTRRVQFPSAINIEGPLNDPQLRVSPLQATADFSAQALLLIPGLTLKLFGIGANDASMRPCETPNPAEATSAALP